jgi:hypothetical protein
MTDHHDPVFEILDSIAALRTWAQRTVERPHALGAALDHIESLAIEASERSAGETVSLVADRAAEQDETVRDEAIHEHRMRVPGRLLADIERFIPRRAAGWSFWISASLTAWRSVRFSGFLRSRPGIAHTSRPV